MRGLLARLALAFFIGALAAFSQGWTQHPGTDMAAVCPANNGGGGSTAPYSTYAFRDMCVAGGVVRAWSSGIWDAPRNRLIIWGGGHTDYWGNEIYEVNFSSGAPVMSRLNNPSMYDVTTGLDAYGVTETNISDNTPVSRHTYGSLVYLPYSQKLFSYSGGTASNGSVSRAVWLLDLPSCTTSSCPPSAWTMASAEVSLPGGYPNTGSNCALNPLTSNAGHEHLLCNVATWMLVDLDYNTATGTITKTNLLGYAGYNGSSSMGENVTMAVDPVRQLLISVGTNGAKNALEIRKSSIASGSNYAITSLGATATGCSALAVVSPGLEYDPDTGLMVAWPNTGNSVLTYNVDTNSCTTYTYSGGPTATNVTGVQGRWRRISTGRYVEYNSATSNVFTFDFNAPTPAGGSKVTGKVTRSGKVAQQ